MVFTNAVVVDELGQRDAPLTYSWSFSTETQVCRRVFSSTRSRSRSSANFSHWAVSEGEHAGVYYGNWDDVSALVADRSTGVAKEFQNEIDALEHARLTIELAGYSLSDHRHPIVTTHVPTGDQMHIASGADSSSGALILDTTPAQVHVPLASAEVRPLVEALGVAPKATSTSPGVVTTSRPASHNIPNDDNTVFLNTTCSQQPVATPASATPTPRPTAPAVMVGWDCSSSSSSDDDCEPVPAATMKAAASPLPRRRTWI
jgi:hypothetical protein